MFNVPRLLREILSKHCLHLQLYPACYVQTCYRGFMPTLLAPPAKISELCSNLSQKKNRNHDKNNLQDLTAYKTN